MVKIFGFMDSFNFVYRYYKYNELPKTQLFLIDLGLIVYIQQLLSYLYSNIDTRYINIYFIKPVLDIYYQKYKSLKSSFTEKENNLISVMFSYLKTQETYKKNPLESPYLKDLKILPYLLTSLNGDDNIKTFFTQYFHLISLNNNLSIDSNIINNSLVIPKFIFNKGDILVSFDKFRYDTNYSNLSTDFQVIIKRIIQPLLLSQKSFTKIVDLLSNYYLPYLHGLPNYSFNEITIFELCYLSEFDVFMDKFFNFSSNLFKKVLYFSPTMSYFFSKRNITTEFNPNVFSDIKQSDILYNLINSNLKELKNIPTDVLNKIKLINLFLSQYLFKLQEKSNIREQNESLNKVNSTEFINPLTEMDNTNYFMKLIKENTNEQSIYDLIGSLEADMDLGSTDEDVGDTDDTDDTEDEDTTEDTGDTEDTEDTDDTDDTEDEDTTEDIDDTGDEGTTEDTGDTGDEGTGNEDTKTENSVTSVKENKYRKLIKYTLELTNKDESLEDFLYKISLYSQIREFIFSEQSKKISAIKLKILKTWICKWIFLTSLSETKKLLKELNIPIK